jgi:Tfp pilus assembly protein PilF
LKDTLLLESLLNKSIVLTDTISDIPLTAAQFYESIGKRDSSIVLLEKYIKKYPENPKYSVQLGYSYFLNNDWEKARYYLSKGYSLDTTNISLLISLGDVLDRLNKPDSAEHYYALAISKNSDDPLANNNYAYFLSQDTAKLQFAIELSKKAILAEPENAAYLDTYGWIMFKMNNLDTAFEYIEKAYKLDSTNYDIMEHLGDIYEKKGNIEQAIEYWEKSLEFNKNKKELIEKINKYRN